MLAIVEAYKAGLLKPANWGRNIIAGVIVGVVALPLAMAFAIASGVKPEQGLYTAIVAGLIVGLFGGSRVQIAGPTGAFIVILASITAQYGVDGLQIATLMAGVILLLMGIARLGSVIKFIPDPVIVGFTSGIGVIIFVGEWKDFFGITLHLPLDASFVQKISALVVALPQLNFNTTALACLSLVLVLITPKIFKRIPGPLVAMVIVTFLQAVFHFKGVATLGSTFGQFSTHLPGLHVPHVTWERLQELLWPAFTIALLGAIESLLSATAADGMAGTRHNSNQELLGQGLANIFTPLFAGIAATGAIARTATNIRNGGNSPIAAITHSVLLILVIVLLAPLASNVPLCALAAILFVVSYYMSDVPHFIYIVKHAPFYDVFILLVTFLLTVFTNLVIAVNIGVVLAMIFFIYRTNQTLTIKQQTAEDLQNELTSANLTTLPNDILIYTIQGPFFFGVAEKFERALAATNTEPKVIIIRLRDVPFMDMTGLETFCEILMQYHKKGVLIYLCEANSRVMRKLAEVNALQWVFEQKVIATLREVLVIVMPKRQ